MNLDFAASETFRGTQIFRQKDKLAYAFTTMRKSVDADGAPNAYHPDDIGLDYLKNAGYPGSSWWRDVLVVDPNDNTKAYVQPTGRYKGYFVSQTSLRILNGPSINPKTYVDATSYPYVVIPSGFENLPDVAKSGDVGLATHLPSGNSTAFIVGDAGGGPTAELGESSIALFVALGSANPNPRNGQGVPRGRIQYILFPKSRPAAALRWPRTQASIASQVRSLIKNTPGIS